MILIAIIFILLVIYKPKIDEYIDDNSKRRLILWYGVGKKRKYIILI